MENEQKREPNKNNKMIKIQIKCDGNKIITDFKDDDERLIENSLVVRELERIKTELVNKQFDLDFEYRDEGEA